MSDQYRDALEEIIGNVKQEQDDNEDFICDYSEAMRIVMDFIMDAIADTPLGDQYTKTGEKL